MEGRCPSHPGRCGIRILRTRAATLRSNPWFILVVLFVARFCLGYQFQSAGSVAPILISEFALDYRQIGTLVGLFMLPGLVLALPGGLLGKRFGDKPVVMMGMAAMILGGVISGGRAILRRHQRWSGDQRGRRRLPSRLYGEDGD